MAMDDEVEFEALISLDVDAEISKEERLFFYEGLNILHRLQKHNGYRPRLEAMTRCSTKHQILYGFLALALVRKAQEDVAAVAVHILKSGVVVHYCKNRVDDSDLSHAAELAGLIRSVAANPRSGMKEFQINIFHMLIKNCKAKVMRRFGEFKHSFQLASKSKDSSIPTTTADLVSALQSWQTKHPAPQARNNADISAISYSPTSNLYEGLILTIQSLQDSIINPKTTSEFVAIGAHAYCVGCSSIMDDVVNEYPRLANVIETARKYSEYFRGASRLYAAITTPGKSDFYKSFSLVHIPSPAPESITLEEDWYYVLEVLYYRYNRRCIPVTKGDFLRTYRKSIDQYKEWSAIKFIPHCEMTLIRYLIPRYSPTEIGVSKSCCATCYEFIKGLNATRMTKRWGIQGGHGNVYLTGRGIELDNDRGMMAGHDAVMDWIVHQITLLVDDLRYQHVTESPLVTSSPEPEEGRGATLWPPRAP
jgi:hypothetical protein